ncbi:MAG TPA: TMEM175 family protein [Pyrinomonadaceae bacterium]|nr:TMEM175 family protein [Pyrinomonadaceae bacterium]
MIREKLIEKGVGLDKDFRMRGTGEVSRLEALSDAVFGFAITLLVVSLEVPQTFNELLVVMRGLIAFAISFLLLFVVWLTQYKFFRRYGLNDNFTIWVNALLLFVVLFYVYPLKFLWNFLVNLVLGFPSTGDGAAARVIEGHQVPTLLVIFGAGYATIFLIFALLYYHAYRKRAQLELNELEIHDTWHNIVENLLHVLIGVLSIVIALVTRRGVAGLIYWLIGPVQFVNGMVMSKRRKRIAERLEAEAQA